MESTTCNTARSVLRNFASCTACVSALRLVGDTWWATATVIAGSSLSSSLVFLSFELVGEFGELVASGHLAGELVEADLGAFFVEDGLAEFQDDEVVADEVGVVGVVGDEHDTEAGVAGGCGVFEDHTGLFDAQG